MRFLKLILFVVLITTSGCKKDIPEWYQVSLDRSEGHLLSTSQICKDKEKLPRSINKEGMLHLGGISDWTSGFFPDSLWMMYQLSGEVQFNADAEFFTNMLSQNQFNSKTHDLGFMMYYSYGNGLKVTHNKEYSDILIQSAKTLASRFDPKIGCICSWDFGEWQYPVIIDNMMNLELLFWAFNETQDSSLYKIVVKHAETTIENHFRKDYSYFHVVSYDTIIASPELKCNFQGFSDSSA